jgi:hypothetical protein
VLTRLQQNWFRQEGKHCVLRTVTYLVDLEQRVFVSPVEIVNCCNYTKKGR